MVERACQNANHPETDSRRGPAIDDIEELPVVQLLFRTAKGGVRRLSYPASHRALPAAPAVNHTSAVATLTPSVTLTSSAYSVPPPNTPVVAPGCKVPVRALGSVNCGGIRVMVG